MHLPILDYPGWYDERHCEAGLFSLPGSADERYADRDLAGELRRHNFLCQAAELTGNAVCFPESTDKDRIASTLHGLNAFK